MEKHRDTTLRQVYSQLNTCECWNRKIGDLTILTDDACALCVAGTLGVTITNLKVPSTVQNGSSGTILDCEYSLLPDEAAPSSGLVIKWYFNSRPAPVYQWIPTQKPQASGVATTRGSRDLVARAKGALPVQDLDLLRGRLDMNYTANSHAAMEHRALRILNATTDLSGEWKCSVSTFKNEDFMIKKMIVFGKSKSVRVQ
ncbi:Selenide, water dikinase 1 [Frankliniella fusca]|uniref:Selenide, water dikinase 1 n=1 Tax=Frankliniella fusca TaxID=407009 RepID=A0AAE1GRS8_9NEOP|nr:Selenide, water dikinase 1 [Frankliniella fusca]